MAKRQAEKADRGEDEDHTGQVEERLEEDRDRRSDVAAGADGRAGREPWSEPVDEAGAHDQGEHEADGRAEPVGHRPSADQKDIDDGEPQHQEPRRPAEADEQNVGEEGADGAARIGGRVDWGDRRPSPGDRLGCIPPGSGPRRRPPERRQQGVLTARLAGARDMEPPRSADVMGVQAIQTAPDSSRERRVPPI